MKEEWFEPKLVRKIENPYSHLNDKYIFECANCHEEYERQKYIPGKTSPYCEKCNKKRLGEIARKNAKTGDLKKRLKMLNDLKEEARIRFRPPVNEEVVALIDEAIEKVKKEQAERD